jgi:hypothetical protein|eukprot:6645280-Prymnesium_polylepis.1
MNAYLLGRLSVQGGELVLTDCNIEPDVHASSPIGEQRALWIGDGHVLLVRVLVQGHRAGAIGVDSAHLTMVLCSIISNGLGAQTGGALLVRGASQVSAEASLLTNNSAAVGGGALHVSLAPGLNPPWCHAIESPYV